MIKSVIKQVIKLIMPNLEEKLTIFKKDIIRSFANKFKLEKVLKYVEEDNELDNKVKEIDAKHKDHEKRLKKLEKK